MKRRQQIRSGDVLGCLFVLWLAGAATSVAQESDGPILQSQEEEALALQEKGDLDAARRLQEEVLAARRRALGNDHVDTIDARDHLAGILYAQKEWSAARELQADVLQARESILGENHPDTLLARDYLFEMLYHLGELEAANEQAEKSLEAHRSLFGKDHPKTLEAKGNLATTLSALGQLDAARELQESVLAARLRVLGADDPQTLLARQEVAVTLYRLGDLEASQRLMAETVAQRSRAQGPEHPDTLYARSNLAMILYAQGEIGAARSLMEELLAPHESLLGEEHPDTLDLHNNLAAVLYEQGDLAAARELQEEILKAFERTRGARHPDTQNPRSNLAVTLLRQGEPGELVLPVLETLLSVQDETLGAAHPKTLITRKILASTLVSEGNLESGRAMMERALAAGEEALGWGHPTTLEIAYGLAAVLREEGRPRTAQQLFQKILAERRRLLGPRHPDTARAMFSLALVERELGETERAEDLLKRTLAIYRETAPGTFDEADTLAELGRLDQERRRLARAAAHYAQAMEALERQIRRLGTRDLEAVSRRRHGEIFRRAIEVLVDLERPVDAFATLERSRARTFLDMLAERDLMLSDVPEELDRARRRLAVMYDRAFARLAEISEVEDPEGFEAQLEELRRLRRESEKNNAAIRRAAPRSAVSRDPVSRDPVPRDPVPRDPLGPDQVRQILDPGTVLLSYSVAERSTFVFAVSEDGPLEAVRLPWGRSELRSRIGLFHELLPTAIPGSSLGDHDASRLEDLARDLYEGLLTPVARRLEKAERLLISPDGPLYRLPFAALVRPGSCGPDREEVRPWCYLVEWKPLHTVLSASVYAELLARRPVRAPSSPESTALVAFGDPLYPGAKETSDRRVRSVLRRGLFDWQALPHSRREVESLADLYDVSRIFLGREATEERVKEIGGAGRSSPRIFHFAAHSYLDDRLPMSSFLALTIPEKNSGDRDNGLLQVWEIFESLRLDADLVVLSSCRSGLGPEQDGEGLIGLTRAFQYAGARSVAATLWNVADDTTAELMIRFHRHLRSGRSKDEALRRAQLELLRGPILLPGSDGRLVERRTSAPYVWAAFQIVGDWR